MEGMDDEGGPDAFVFAWWSRAVARREVGLDSSIN
jgi:hypothetical protein